MSSVCAKKVLIGHFGWCRPILTFRFPFAVHPLHPCVCVRVSAFFHSFISSSFILIRFPPFWSSRRRRQTKYKCNNVTHNFYEVAHQFDLFGTLGLPSQPFFLLAAGWLTAGHFQMIKMFNSKRILHTYLYTNWMLFIAIKRRPCHTVPWNPFFGYRCSSFLRLTTDRVCKVYYTIILFRPLLREITCTHRMQMTFNF